MGAPGAPKITRVEADGTRTILVEAEAFDDQVPVTAVAVNEGQVFVVHAGTVSLVGSTWRRWDLHVHSLASVARQSSARADVRAAAERR
jgi:hypothetical protein